MKKNTLLNKQIVENICNETHGNTLTGELQREIKLLSLRPNEGTEIRVHKVTQDAKNKILEGVNRDLLMTENYNSPIETPKR